MQPGRLPARKTGLEPPLSGNQKKAWVLQSSCTGLFWALAASFLASSPADGVSGGGTAWLVAVLAAHGALVLVGASTWWWLEHHNPLDPGFRKLLPDSARWTKMQYCAKHKAKIEGLDHHCTWLNVSVGRSNYAPFMLLTATGAAQFGLQFACGLLLLCGGGTGAFDAAGARARIGDGDAPFVAWAVLLALHALQSAFIGGCYAKLLNFHATLARQGRGTYDWLLAQRQAARQQKAPAAAVAATAAAAAAAAAPPPPAASTAAAAAAPEIEMAGGKVTAVLADGQTSQA